MKVIIVAKTKMRDSHCIGGIAWNKKFLRLLDENGNNFSERNPFEIGQIWDMEFTNVNNVIAPHTEDVLIQSKSYTNEKYSREELSKLIQHNFSNRIWRGNPKRLFNGLINFTTSGVGYISKSNLTNYSVGFWIPDQELIRRTENEKVRYNYVENPRWKNIPYVGTDETIRRIPQDTLIRVSLARWWSYDSNTEERCYLQLSGWYID